MTSNSQNENNPVAPEHTAVRVALWRALHTLIDQKPHILTDDIGAKLVCEEGWQNRPDMNPQFSKPMRASIVGRARLIEDLVEDQVKSGVTQYVILGAGLDTFALRRPEIASRIQIFEVDQPGPQTWKKQRIAELEYHIPKSLHFVPVDFEGGKSWWTELLATGFDPKKQSVVVSTGVSMYLTKETNTNTLERLANLPRGSTFAMTFLLALELLSAEERATLEFVMKKAKESGTPFLSLFDPKELRTLAKNSGFAEAKYISANDIYKKYFADRTDGLRAGDAEAFLLAST